MERERRLSTERSHVGGQVGAWCSREGGGGPHRAAEWAVSLRGCLGLAQKWGRGLMTR